MCYDSQVMVRPVFLGGLRMVGFDINEFPIGNSFIKFGKSIEDRCEVETESRIWEMGNKAPECYEGVGTVLSYLDRMGSCHWGCHGNDHSIQYLCGVASSNGRAALRLIQMGFYDESLLIVRHIGEVANLLMLFRMDGSSFEEWNLFPKRFTPAEVRVRLKSLTSLEPPIDHERYSALSQRFVHPNPELRPQLFNLVGVPTTGGIFQEAGLLVTLNELALPLAYACIAGALTLHISDDLTSDVEAAVEHLLGQVGEVDIAGFDRIVEAALTDEQARETLRTRGRSIVDFQKSLKDFWHTRTTPKLPLGRWLVENMPRDTNLEPPPREDFGRRNPFLDETAR